MWDVTLPNIATSQQTDRYRRGVYVIGVGVHRTRPSPILMLLIEPLAWSAVVGYITPPKALTLLNDPMYWEMTRALGQHLHQERQRDGAVSLRGDGVLCIYAYGFP